MDGKSPRRAILADLPLRTKGLIVVFIPLIGLLAVIIALYFIQIENQSAQQWVQHSLEVRSQIQAMHTQLEEAETGLRGYLLSGNREWLGSYMNARERLPRTLDRLESMVEDNPQQLAHVRQVESLSSAKLNEMAALATERREANAAGANAALQQSETHMDRLRAELAAMQSEEEGVLKARLDHAENVWKRSYILLLAGVVLAPFGGIAAMLLFTAGIARRVQTLDEDAHRLAQGAPLPPAAPAKDEIGHLEVSLREAGSLLAQRETELRGARDELEIRVQDRTAELARANESLQSEMDERMRADEGLREATDTVRAVLQASPLAIIGLDLEGNVKSWNHAAEEVFGWTEQEVLGRRLPSVPEEDLDWFLRNARSTEKSEMLNGTEKRSLRKDGVAIDTRIWTAVLRDASGAPSGKIAIIHDVTERKRLEQQLFQAQKMEAIGRLAGGVAHDFNNIITVISGYGEMLKEGTQDRPELGAAAEEVLKASDRAAALAGQLLAFSRRQVMQLKTVDLNQLVANFDRMLRRVIGEDIELRTVLPPTTGTVRADPGQIEQVIMNLAVNARDAMPRGGKLTIETSSAEIGEMADSAQTALRPGSYAVLMVTDTGQGMDAEIRSHLFEPFFTTKERGKGTGLGLSTVYGIVKQHGGDIWVYSEPGLGSRFKIFLPQVQEAAAAATPEADGREVAWTGTETILLAEDEEGVRKLVRGVLEQHGYKVVEARDGAEALKLWEQQTGAVDLLITDLVMPNMNGEQLAQALSLIYPEMKVLFLSGYAEQAMTKTGDGRFDFLEKPFNPETLARRVRKILDT